MSDIVHAIRNEDRVRAVVGTEALDCLLERKRQNAIKTAETVLIILKTLEPDNGR